MLYLTSVAAIKHNRELKKYYFDKISAGMPAKKTLIKVATKIAWMMYFMLKYKTSYKPERVFLQTTSLVAAQPIQFSKSKFILNFKVL